MWVLWELDLTQSQEDPGKGRSREGSWRFKEKSFVGLPETPLVDKSEPPGKSEKPDTSFAELGLRRGDAWRGLLEDRASAQLPHLRVCSQVPSGVASHSRQSPHSGSRAPALGLARRSV